MTHNEIEFAQRACLAMLHDAGMLLIGNGVEIPHESLSAARERAFAWVNGEATYTIPFDVACDVAAGTETDHAYMRHAFVTRTRGVIGRRIAAPKPKRSAPRFTAEPSTIPTATMWWRRVYTRRGVVRLFARNASEAAAWIGAGVAEELTKA